MFPRLCHFLNKLNKRIFLLGGSPGVADKTAVWIHDHAPGLCVVGAMHGFFNPEHEARICQKIKNSGADILLVAMGAPRQEIWISRNLSRCGVKIAMGVGGLFDFYSGRIPRAPSWMREIGLEWVFRLYQEPGRLWKRYLIGNFVFLYHVFRQSRRRKIKGSGEN
jgi:N-acetylglucosaminyldiphosphoundecaprenol N-acetyl-beta-D-mannosaminyltransferase